MADILHIRDFQPIATREDAIDAMAKEFERLLGETVQVERLDNVVDAWTAPIHRPSM
jgi:hypothetical protein